MEIPTVLAAAMSAVASIIVYWVMMRQRVRREQSMAELERVYRELEEAHTRLAARAGQERELAVLRERGRLAREMHDTLGHALVLVSVKLEAARRLRAVDPARADHELDATQGLVRDATRELRASLAALRSPVLGQGSLADTLSHLVRDAGQRAGWHVVYDLGPIGYLDDATTQALLRVGGEALANAERHAGAHAVTLTLRRDAVDALLLRVADDGVGLPGAPTGASDGAPPADVAAAHYGITGMRERVAALGGTLAIRPGARGGTVVEARVPAAAPAAVRPDDDVAARGPVPAVAPSGAAAPA